MADERTYIKVHDGMPEHPKVGRVGGDAAWLNVCAIAYCSRNRTDGHFPVSVIPRLSDRKSPLKLAEKLVGAGMWHDLAHTCGECPAAEPDGFVIHHYLEHQRSAAQIEAMKEQRRTAGRSGGLAKGKRGAKQVAKQTASKTQADTEGFLQNPQTEANLTVPTEPAQGTAQTLIAEWLDHCDGPVPSQVKGQVAKVLGQVLAEGFDYGTVRNGFARWHERRLHPATLPSVIHEVAQGPGTPQRPNRAEERTRGALALVAKLEAEERQTGEIA